MQIYSNVLKKCWLPNTQIPVYVPATTYITTHFSYQSINQSTDSIQNPIQIYLLSEVTPMDWHYKTVYNTSHTDGSSDKGCYSYPSAASCALSTDSST